MTYKEIKDKHAKAYNDLMEQAGVFWAFNNDQFKEGIKKLEKSGHLKKGDKLVRIPAGGLCPKHNIDTFLKGIKQANKTKTKELKEAREAKKEAILYELNNYECFYTGEIDDVVDIFKGIYTFKDIKKVYSDNYANAEL